MSFRNRAHHAKLGSDATGVEFHEQFLIAGLAAACRLRTRPDYDQAVEGLATAVVEMMERHGGHPMNVILWMFKGELPIPDLLHADEWEWWAAATAVLMRMSPAGAETN